MLGLIATALAVDVLLYAPEGAPSPAGLAPIEVALIEGGRPVEGRDVFLVVPAPASVVAEGEVAPGRYRFRYRAPPEGSAQVTVHVAGEVPSVRSLVLAPAPVPSFGAPGEIDAPVGTPRIEVLFPRAGGAGSGALVARVSEGRVLEVREVPDGVLVAVEPGAERYARVVAVGLVDLEDPRATPTFTLVRLRARPTLTLTAEPRSTVTVKVGRRSYGPFVADASGAVNVAFDALPGESSYELTVSDDLGNTQRSQGPLPTASRPVLVGVETPLAADRGAELWLGAWSPTGAVWTGPAPLCRSGAGVRTEATAVGKGIFRTSVESPDDGGALFDPRVECGLGDASVALRVPLGAERPERIELRVYPESLSADFPIAQVQAALLDRRGERLAPDGLAVSAAAGELQLEAVDGALRGEYRGAAAVERGGDTLTAAWNHPPGSGRAWGLSLALVGDGEELVAVARAVDRLARPLADVPLRVQLGALSAEARTDARGWARVTFPTVPSVATLLRVDTENGIARERVWIPGAPDPLPDLTAPDLRAEQTLPIGAGRVRQVFLDVEPRPLVTGTGGTGTVVVRMLDAAGTPVRDEPITIGASEGTVEAPQVQSDGSLRARYTPPPGPIDRTVRITATSSAGTVSTDLELEPRPVRGALGLSAGWISNFGTVSAPTLSLSLYQQLPLLPKVLTARVGVSAYNLDIDVDDPFAEATIGVRATLVPIDLGLQVIERWGRTSLHAGIAAVVVPYAMTADFGDNRGLSGVAVASPGLAVQAGGGWRLGSSELFAETRFLLYTASGGQVSFEGSVGGVSLAAGYRLLY